MIEREEVDGVSIVRMAHGKVHAFDVEFLAALRDTFLAIADEPYRGVVLTGTGSAFSAGVDLRRMVAEGVPYVRQFLPLLHDAFLALFNVPRPVVAAVNGHALAGGYILLSAADERILADGRGRIGLPEVQVGVPFPAAPLEIVRYAGGSRVLRLVTTGETFGMRETVEMGLGDELVPADELLSRATSRAAFLAEMIPPRTFQITKRTLRAETNTRIDAALRTTEAEVNAVWESPETLQWMERYLVRVTGGGAGR